MDGDTLLQLYYTRRKNTLISESINPFWQGAHHRNLVGTNEAVVVVQDSRESRVAQRSQHASTPQKPAPPPVVSTHDPICPR